MATRRLPPLPGIGDLLRVYRVGAKKHLSQNFLLDPAITDRFARCAITHGKQSLSNAHVIEVGGGPGALTRSILRCNPKHLTVIERDSRMLPFLNMLADVMEGQMTVIHGDALEMDYADLARKHMDDDTTDCKIIGNLPFNIASPLLIKFLRLMARDSSIREERSHVQPAAVADTENPNNSPNFQLTLSFQSEVGSRIVALPGAYDRSRVSVMCQHVCNVQKCFTIPGKSFIPPPKVNAAVVQLEPNDTVWPITFQQMETVTRLMFSHRRKTIRNNIKKLLQDCHLVDKIDSDDFIDRCDLDPSIRPQELHGHHFVKIAEELETIRELK